MAASAQQRMSLFSLLALVVGSMIGAGVFSLPRTFAAATDPFGAIIAWCIARWRGSFRPWRSASLTWTRASTLPHIAGFYDHRGVLSALVAALSHVGSN